MISKPRSSIIGPSIIAVATIAMLMLSWRCWPDPITDFGRELYVPWQLSEGKTLYRDIAYFNGPLSPYFNATLFRMFGAHLMTLAWANIAILCAVVILLHRITARISDEFTATIATLAFVLLLAIGQPGPAANYNFVTPYSHEMTHGFALALVSILCVMNFAQSKRTLWTIVAGLSLGMVFLTKPEIFIATAVACAAAAFLSAWRLRDVLIMCATGLIAPMAALSVCGMDALGAWRWIFDSALVDQHFYKFIRGTDDTGASLGAIAVIGTGYLVALGIPIAIAMFVRPKKPMFVAGAVLAIVAIVLFLMRGSIDWVAIGRPLIVVSIVILSVLAKDLRKRRSIGFGDSSRITARLSSSKSDQNDVSVQKIVFAIFAVALLPKIALHVALYHYGFVLAAPALVITVVALVAWIPKWIDSRGGCGAIARAGALGQILALCIVYVGNSHARCKQKTITVGAGADAFYADARGQSVNEILEELPKGKTLAVIPQGAMINFLARRENPTPFVVLMPPEVIMFGDDRMAAAYQKHPPDLLLIFGMDLGEYGYKSFPQYAPKLAAWIDGNYTTVMRGEAKALPWRLLRANSNEENTPAHP